MVSAVGWGAVGQGLVRRPLGRRKPRRARLAPLPCHVVLVMVVVAVVVVVAWMPWRWWRSFEAGFAA